MLRLIILAILIDISVGSVAVWEKCANKDWAKNCLSGSVCVSSDPWYSQCIPKTELCVKRPVNVFDGEISAWNQCGRGGIWKKECHGLSACVVVNSTFYQCQPYTHICPNDQLAARRISTIVNKKLITIVSNEEAVPDWHQCGGQNWQKNCSVTSICIAINSKYFQCVPYTYLCSEKKQESLNGIEEWGQCGKGGEWLKNCSGAASCVVINPWYFQCITIYQICVDIENNNLIWIQYINQAKIESKAINTSTLMTSTTKNSTVRENLTLTTISTENTSPITSDLRKKINILSPSQIIKPMLALSVVSNVANEWEQCGGKDWKISCVSTAVCIAINYWVSKCIPIKKICSEPSVIHNAEIPVWSQCGQGGKLKSRFLRM